jgi:hypothetical protein
MDILMIVFALLGGSTSDKTIDPASMVAKQFIKGVYDEKRVETVATFKEKYPPNFLD